MRVVVSLVAVEFGRASSAGSAPGADGRYPADEGLEGLVVVQVGAGDADREGQPVPVDDEVDFRSALTAFGLIRSRQCPPLTARTLTESIAHRDQSNSP